MLYARKKCLHCDSTALRPLFNIMERGVSHAAAMHKNIHSYRALAICESCELAQLEAHSHDCWGYHGDEDWDMYWWYLFDAENTAALSTFIAACPKPLTPDCSCEVHQQLRTAVGSISGRRNVPHAVYASDSTEYLRLKVDITKDGIQFEKSDDSYKANATF